MCLHRPLRPRPMGNAEKPSLSGRAPVARAQPLLLHVLAVVAALAIPAAFAEDSGVVPDNLVSRVIHISVDGLRPLDDFFSGVSLPNFDTLFEEGTCTNNARIDPRSSQTLPVHTSQFTGQFVKDHGLLYDDYDKGDTLPAHLDGKNIFDIVSNAGLTPCMFASKPKFQLFVDSWEGLTRANSYISNSKDGKDVFDAWRAKKNSCHYSFVHWRNPDRAGHGNGGADNSKYREAVRQVDALLGQVFDAVDLSDTAIILTTDHGFTDDGNHGDEKHPDNYVIPFCAIGNGVPAGEDLYDLNGPPLGPNPPSRIDPGGGNPGTTGPQPVRCHDAGPLASDFLGLSPSASSDIPHMNNDLFVTVPSGSGGPGKTGTTATKAATTAAAASTTSATTSPATTNTTPKQLVLSDHCDDGRKARGFVGCKSGSECCSGRCEVKQGGKNKGLPVCIKALDGSTGGGMGDGDVGAGRNGGVRGACLKKGKLCNSSAECCGTCRRRKTVVRNGKRVKVEWNRCTG